jgi:hypothetical protein
MKIKKLITESIELYDAKGNLRMSLAANSNPDGPRIDLYGADRSIISLSIFDGTSNITIREPDGRTAITIARLRDGKLGIEFGPTVISSPALQTLTKAGETERPTKQDAIRKKRNQRKRPQAT